MNKSKVSRGFLILLLLLLISCLKLYKINGGLVLGEPDEFTHAELAKSFHKSPWPYAENYGGPWYFELPLYPFLGFLVSHVFRNEYYLSLRFVSFLTSLFLVWGIYLYLGYKFSREIGLTAALIFLFSPLSVYYSRIGVLEMTTFSFALLFLFTLDYALEKKSLPASLGAGLFLGLSLLSKYSAFIFVTLLGIYFFYLFIKENFSGWNLKNWRKKLELTQTIALDLYLTVAVATFSVVVLPIALILRQHDPYHFKLHLLTNLGQIHDFWWVRGKGLSIASYGADVLTWFAWPVIILSLPGFLYLLGNWRRFHLLLMGFILTLAFVLPRTPFYPRYSFSLVPFLSIFTAFGLWQLFLLLKKWVKLPFIVYSFFLSLLLIPSAASALLASHHHLIEDVGAYIKEQGEEDPWIFSNYWPIFFGKAAGSSKATWLADSAWEARAFIPSASESPLEILREEGGFVVLESLYSSSPIFIHPEARLRAFKLIENRYMPKKTIVDRSPNFPHFGGSFNKARIYRISSRSP